MRSKPTTTPIQKKVQLLLTAVIVGLAIAGLSAFYQSGGGSASELAFQSGPAFVSRGYPLTMLRCLAENCTTRIEGFLGNWVVWASLSAAALRIYTNATNPANAK